MSQTEGWHAVVFSLLLLLPPTLSLRSVAGLGDEDEGPGEATASTLPPPDDTPIPYAEGLCLRNLFRYPSSSPSNPEVAARASGMLASFWGHSRDALAKEGTTYDREHAAGESPAATEPRAGSSEDVAATGASPAVA